VLLTQWGGGEVGGEAFVVPDASPNPLGSRLSASVSRSPHLHPKEVVAKDHTERGPFSIILSPHSSHSRMPPLEEPFIAYPLHVVPRPNLAYAKGHHIVNLTDAAALSIMAPSLHASCDRGQGQAT
jgi:hypothetical protein